jgi:hypothetical protein
MSLDATRIGERRTAPRGARLPPPVASSRGIGVTVDGAVYPLTVDEIRRIVDWLELPTPHTDAEGEAKALLHRVLEDPEADVPLVSESEARAILGALERALITVGLSSDELRFCAALRDHFRHTDRLDR